MPPRVLIAGLFHETHTFLDQVTRSGDFQVVRGPAVLEREGDGSPLGSALLAGRTFGWQFVPTVDFRTQPSGTVEDDAFDHFWRDFCEHAEPPLRAGLDAIYLVLHGAMVTQSCKDIEGKFLERLRRLAGARDLPVFGVFDLHANFTARMAQHSDCLVAYRQNPHADSCERAVQAAELLQVTLRSGRRPRTYWQHAAIVWPPTGTGTADSPMVDLEALARRCEAEHPEILAINVCAGFAYADTPDTGVSFSVVTADDGAAAENLAKQILSELCARAWELRHAGNVLDPSLESVIKRLRENPPGLTVIAEPSDNVGGGAPGDGTGLLRAFIKHNISRAAVCLCDAEAVRNIAGVPLGSSIQLALGGRGSRLDKGPLHLAVTVVSHADGRFRLEDSQSHLASMFGGEFDMGRCAVVRHGGVTILLTSRKTPPFDLGQWRSQGIEPKEMSAIGVKAAVAHRRAYESIADRLWSVDTPGPCCSNLRTFPYEHLRRPVFPLDDEV